MRSRLAHAKNVRFIRKISKAIKAEGMTQTVVYLPSKCSNPSTAKKKKSFKTSTHISEMELNMSLV
jgi:hypothetical protein